MPQMAPILWTPIMMMTMLTVILIKTSMFFENKKKK
uniref:ATP synthase F0 subunit 8 n=1 Tax=Ugyops sp. APL-2018 TaxID=2250388 RepID=A0A3G1RJA7_9HEMI|nr:ATP synthase F0 subunit 8 [Ugyops sp. APL-2018]